MSSQSSPILNIKPDLIDTPEKRSAFALSVIGLDANGLLHSCLFADAGFKVTCADSDQACLDKLAMGEAPLFNNEIGERLSCHVKTGRIVATSDLKKACSEADIIVLSLDLKIDSKKRPDQSRLEKLAKHVGSCMRRGVLVMLISIAGLGTVEGTFKEILESTSGYKTNVDFALAYSPTPTQSIKSLDEIRNSERIIGSPNKATLAVASAIIKTFMRKAPKETDDLKLAELTALYLSTHEDVTFSLGNEFALLCENANLDFNKVSKLAFGTNAIPKTDPAVINEKLRAASYAVIADSEDLNVDMETVCAARRVNERIVKHEAQLIRDALKSACKPVSRARIALLGISLDKNTRGPLSESAYQLVGLLEAKEAKVGVYDPYYPEKEELGEIQKNHRRTFTEALEGTDCLAILTGHHEFSDINLKKVKAMMKKSPCIVDFEGILDPQNVEAEGFVYRGFGRGVWTK